MWSYFFPAQQENLNRAQRAEELKTVLAKIDYLRKVDKNLHAECGNIDDELIRAHFKNQLSSDHPAKSQIRKWNKSQRFAARKHLVLAEYIRDIDKILNKFNAEKPAEDKNKEKLQIIHLVNSLLTSMNTPKEHQYCLKVKRNQNKKIAKTSTPFLVGFTGLLLSNPLTGIAAGGLTYLLDQKYGIFSDDTTSVSAVKGVIEALTAVLPKQEELSIATQSSSLRDELTRVVVNSAIERLKI